LFYFPTNLTVTFLSPWSYLYGAASVTGFIYETRSDTYLLRRCVKPGMADDGKVRVWLVERTYSDDEQNLIILEYATIDGERYMRKERALTSFDDVRETTAAIDVDPGNVAPVKDDGLRERYAAEAERISQRYEPEESV
jgi:hypothetical protein